MYNNFLVAFIVILILLSSSLNKIIFVYNLLCLLPTFSFNCCNVINKPNSYIPNIQPMTLTSSS